MIIDGRVIFQDFILPSENSGRYSRYNIYGRSIIKRSLPKIKKIFSFNLYPYGNTNAGSITVYVEREVYQREEILPEYVNIKINLLNEAEEYCEFLFEIDEILDKNDIYFNYELLAYINIMQENLIGYNVYSENDTPSENIIKISYVDWEFLPPDEIDEKYVKKIFPHKSKAEQDIIFDRFEFLKSLNPKEIIKAINSFNYYYGAKLDNNIVLLENFNAGNAIYIFYSNWEDLTKLSRTQLIHMKSANMDRVLHKGNWKGLVKYLIANHLNISYTS